MSRAKEAGKPVEELKIDELHREYERCKVRLAFTVHRMHTKHFQQRVKQIEARLEELKLDGKTENE